MKDYRQTFRILSINIRKKNNFNLKINLHLQKKSDFLFLRKMLFK